MRNPQRQPPAGGGIVVARQGQPIEFLRPQIVADEIESEPAIRGHLYQRIARGLRFGEEAQRLDGTALGEEDPAQARLHARISRRDILRPDVKTHRRVTVAERDRGFPRFEQGIEVGWAPRQAPQRFVEILRLGRRQRLDDCVLRCNRLGQSGEHEPAQGEAQGKSSKRLQEMRSVTAASGAVP